MSEKTIYDQNKDDNTSSEKENKPITEETQNEKGENSAETVNINIKEYDELNDKYLRIVAEYDNYRKRAIKERDGVYADAYNDVLKEILPIIDNLERAAQYTDSNKVSEGVKLTLNQFGDVIKRLGIEEIEAKGSTFDPLIHNAVMHFEDENFGENEITEVFEKGYKKGDKVLRYAMVKVAN